MEQLQLNAIVLLQLTTLKLNSQKLSIVNSKKKLRDRVLMQKQLERDQEAEVNLLRREDLMRNHSGMLPLLTSH